MDQPVQQVWFIRIVNYSQVIPDPGEMTVERDYIIDKI
jgi:hypothetical protein